jgi:hypothetical protein
MSLSTSLDLGDGLLARNGLSAGCFGRIVGTNNLQSPLPRAEIALAEIAVFTECLKIVYGGLATGTPRDDVIHVQFDPQVGGWTCTTLTAAKPIPEEDFETKPK